MFSFLYVYIRRFKWDLSYYIRCRWQDVCLCGLFVLLGIILGSVVTVNNDLVRESIILRIISGTYSPIGTFIKVMIFTFLTFLLISYTAFCKLYHMIHYIIIFYWGYRFGVDLMVIVVPFTGFISIVFIDLPYYLFNIFLFVSLIIHIRIILPSPRLNWWCYSRCMWNNCIRRSLYLAMPACFVNIVIFIINPLIIQVFSVVI